MEPIKETVEKLIQNWQSQQKKQLVLNPKDLLKKALSKKALKHIKFSNFHQGVFKVKVDSSTWLYYLSLQKPDLLAKLRQKSDKVKDIRFSLGD